MHRNKKAQNHKSTPRTTPKACRSVLDFRAMKRKYLHSTYKALSYGAVLPNYLDMWPNTGTKTYRRVPFTFIRKNR